jgi:ABC-type multidrug transport system fused ATPase/permease subunit
VPPQIPHPDPGVPDTPGPFWYMWWLVRCQRWRVLRGSVVGTAWMVGLAVQPYLIARAIAHTEARIAERLRQARQGRTTVLVATSPLLLGRADTVAYLSDGRVVATGTHAELLERDGGYRALVSRDSGASAVDDTVGVGGEGALR